MKVTFSLGEEKTVTNETVKVILSINGIVADQTKENIDKSILDKVLEFLPDKKSEDWAFSGFSFYDNRGFRMFAVQASTRIPASENDNLSERARDLSNDSISVEIANIDLSIPQYRYREAESELRQAILKRAKEEAEKLSKAYGGSGPKFKVSSVEFEAPITAQPKGMRAAPGSAFFESTYSNAGGGEGIGHSEKTTLNAVVTVKSQV